MNTPYSKQAKEYIEKIKHLNVFDLVLGNEEILKTLRENYSKKHYAGIVYDTGTRLEIYEWVMVSGITFYSEQEEIPYYLQDADVHLWRNNQYLTSVKLQNIICLENKKEKYEN